jgi:hypothetical protein
MAAIYVQHVNTNHRPNYVTDYSWITQFPFDQLRAGRSSIRSSISGKSNTFFSIPKRPGRFRPTQPPIQQNRRGAILITHLHLVSRSRMSGAKPPLPQYSFMAATAIRQNPRISSTPIFGLFTIAAYFEKNFISSLHYLRNFKAKNITV